MRMKIGLCTYYPTPWKVGFTVNMGKGSKSTYKTYSLPTFGYLDAGQPEVVQRGSPWYEKLFFGCFCGQNLKSRL